MGLSVIIPTLNAETTLPATLASIAGADQIIIADGGSTDRTTAIAPDAQIITAPRGRGTQIAAGITAATQDWLLILHADTRLSEAWREAVAAHTNPNQAGYFRFTLDTQTRAARRLEHLVAWRCRTLALPYGDQGLLIHRDLLNRVGGVRPIPLMEDVDLVRRLGRDRLTALNAEAITSAAKWQRNGYIRRSTRNLFCLTLWFLGVPPSRIVRLYQ